MVSSNRRNPVMPMRKSMSRRRVLRGFLGGGAVTLGLPFLECFLDGNGRALANGQAIPVRFGTWFWQLGMNDKVWTPENVGPDYDVKPELEAIGSMKRHVNLFSRFRLDLE